MAGLGQPVALAFLQVGCVRGGRLLFESMDFALGPGSAALVTGPNGTGKSSLLRIAAGLLPPASGTVDRSGAIALASESHALDREVALVDALRFWARLDGVDASAVMRALEVMAIAHLADVPVRILSTGQKKRAALARVIAAQAAIWLLDEPANGLDSAAQALLATAMADHRAAGGIIMVASHQPIALPDAQTIALGS